MKQTPQAAAEAATVNPVLPSGDAEHLDERVTGYGVMGLPFTSGHYLAFRCWTRTWMGPGYRSVWHRDPSGTWTIYATEPPERSCARYLSSASANEPVTCPIEMAWSGPGTLRLSIDGVLSWEMEISDSAVTRLMSGPAAMMPSTAWNSKILTRAMEQVTRPLLGAGRVQLAGRMPNGQQFLAVPQRIWEVLSSRVTLHGTDIGPVGPLAEQDRLGDFWLPQRGMFAVGWARFEAHDPARHYPLPASVPDQAVVRGEQAG